KTLDEHYTLFDNSDVLFESYIYPNLTKTCNDLLALKETEKKEELFDLLLGITKTYTANIQKSGQTVKTLFLLKRLQQTIKTGMDALLAKKLIAYVEKWSAFLTSTFNASSEKARNYYAHMLVFPKTEGISKPHPATSALYANTQEDLKKLLNSAYYFEEWNKPEYRMAYTGKYASYLTKDEKAVLLVMNLCRLDPVLFEKTFVKKYLERHPGELGSYSTSLINTLKKGNKALPYLPDSVLFLAAQLHAKNYGELGKEGHGGLYGDPDGRAKHFGYIGTGVGESCDYGMSLPEEIVLHLLVDKDVPGVGHRLSIITQEYVAVGISIQPHTQYGTNCVIDLTD
ncbi:MAG TPA: CAP domain-containing protein, partial [Flavobacteriales bacterium]|nr:CAP domain-containing protein [Flavobacteriales bacterium]